MLGCGQHEAHERADETPHLFTHWAAQQCDAAGSYTLLQSGCQRRRLVWLVQHIAAEHDLESACLHIHLVLHILSLSD